MAIAPINASVSVQSAAKKVVSNPIKSAPVVQEKQVVSQDDKGALKSYFLGRNALTVSFSGFPVSTGGFITKRMDDVPCSCCGGRMVRNSEMNTKAKEFANLRGEELANKINADKDFFRTPQRVVMMLAADEARKNPSFDLTRAKSAAGKSLKEKTQAYCVNSLQQADEIIKSKYGENHQVSKLIGSEIEKINGGDIGRLKFTEKLVALQSSMDEETYEKVMDAAMNIPVAFGEVNKAFREANGTPMEVARNLLKPSMQTIEHIHPKSLGGPNATQNFVAECADCNNPRGNMSYAQWLKIHPEFPIKAQRHIEWFQQMVVDGKIKQDYDDYGVDVKQTLSKESNGIIELKVLNPEKIKELREAKNTNQEVSVRDEIAEENGQKKKTEEA